MLLFLHPAVQTGVEAGICARNFYYFVLAQIARNVEVRMVVSMIIEIISIKSILICGRCFEIGMTYPNTYGGCVSCFSVTLSLLAMSRIQSQAEVF